MNKFNRNSTGVALAVVFALGFVAPIKSFAATAPSLGAESTYAIVSSTFTNSNTAPQTVINGDRCDTTPPGTAPLTTTGTITTGGCDPATGTAQSAALNNVTDGLNTQACTTIAGTLNGVIIGANPAGMFPPGCYAVTGAMNITTGTSVTLDATAPGGAGSVWIFRSTGALTTGASTAGFPSVVLANGATASNVFWAPAAATTLGANFALSLTPTFVGSILDAAGISIGHFTNLSGRALAFGGTVLTDANTITVPPSTLATLHVVKVVVNNSGGTSTPPTFNLHVQFNGTDVAGSPAAGAASPGTSYSLAAGTYVVSEDTSAAYTQTFSASCPAGSITLSANDNQTCTITNTDIAPTLHVIKLVVNTGSGTAVASSFSLNVKSATSTSDVAGSPAAGLGGVGTPYTLYAGTFLVSEAASTTYTQSFSASCPSGSITLFAGDAKTCTLTNTYVTPVVTPPAAPPAPVVSSGGGGGGTSMILPIIGISKVASPLALPGGAGSVTYNYTVWNVGERSALVNVTVTDNKCSTLTLLYGSDTNGNGKLDLGEVWKYSCTEVLSTTTTNTAIATGYGDDVFHQSTIATAIATVVVGTSSTPILPSPFIAPLASVVFLVPNLPDTGFPPQGESTQWGIIMAAGILAVSLLIYVNRKKQDA